ncbi:MAG: hypothetical protein WA431_08545 [Candidatus Cybelea sp.]
MFISAVMMTADLALVLLINRTSGFYVANAPAYMTYTEHTRISAPSMGRSQDINRSVAVRVADNFAVMQDLPEGAQRTGQAFPVIAYFDAFSAFSYTYFAGLKRVDIAVRQGRPLAYSTPAPDQSVNAVVPYNSFWAAQFAPDSTDTALHIVIEPTARVPHSLYPSEVIEDPSSQLPAHVEWRGTGGDDEVLTFDYQILQGHWVLVHATFSQTQHALGSFKVFADVRFANIAFPTQAPDPRLAGTPAPGPSAAPI